MNSTHFEWRQEESNDDINSEIARIKKLEDEQWFEEYERQQQINGEINKSNDEIYVNGD